MSYKLNTNVKPLTAAKEKEAFENFHSQDTKKSDAAADLLLSANSKLIFKLAQEFKHHPIPFDDLIAEGCVGLMVAAGKFDISRGTRFITYAAWWIKQRMRKAVETQSRTVRVPAKTHVTKSRLLRMQDQLRDELGYQPDIYQLSEYTGMPEAKIKTLLNSLGHGVSVDAESEDTEMSNLEKARVAIADDLGDLLDDSELLDEMRKAFKRLPKRDQFVLGIRYGLDGSGVSTLEEVAQEVGRCRERCRQLQDEALKKLRREIRKRTS